MIGAGGTIAVAAGIHRFAPPLIGRTPAARVPAGRMSEREADVRG